MLLHFHGNAFILPSCGVGLYLWHFHLAGALRFLAALSLISRFCGMYVAKCTHANEAEALEAAILLNSLHFAAGPCF